MIERTLLLLLFMGVGLWAQYPAPHAGWRLVPGGENLIASGYWGEYFKADSYGVTAAPPPATIAVSNGVLTATTGAGYFGGPTNLGPWLNTSGDFGVVATIQTGPGMNGYISLTGSFATGSQYWQGNTVIEAGMGPGGGYSLFYFDGTSPNVAQSAGANGSPNGPLTIELLRQNNQFMAYFNGTPVGPLPDTGLFAKQFVMPGFVVAPGQTIQIAQFAFEVPQSDTLAQLIEPVGPTPVTRAADTPGSLAPVAGKIFSLASSIDELALGGSPNGLPNWALAPKVIGQFGSLAVFETGFDQVEPAQGWYDFDAADAAMATSRATGRTPVFCHGMLGGGTNVTPYWVINGNFTPAQLTQIIQSHVQTVVSRYKGLCDSWTIVNESLSDADGSVLTTNVWGKTLGSSYIDIAFQAARQADPLAKLYLTDYNVENAGVKATGLYNQVAGMKQRGIPIDGVGWQGHFTLNGPQPYPPNYAQMMANMAKFASLGVLVRFTELDEKILLPATPANLASQGTDYSAIVQACLDSPNCVGIQAFDSDDLTSWIPGAFPGYGAATLFDASFNPKPAYTSVMNTLRAAKHAPSTILSVHTMSGGAVIAQNTFIEIRGFNLVPAATPAAGVIWSSAPDLAQGKLPTTLNGVSVTVNAKPAFVYFYCSVVTSPVCTVDQVNVLTPLDSATGPVQVVVTSGSASSAAFTVNMQATSPALLQFNSTGPVVATHLDGRPVGSWALYPGVSRPAVPGETVLLAGVGFGPPATPLTSGSSTQAGPLPFVPVCQVAATSSDSSIALVSPGVYRLGLTIPPSTLDGNNAVTCAYNGVSTQAGATINVQQYRR